MNLNISTKYDSYGNATLIEGVTPSNCFLLPLGEFETVPYGNDKELFALEGKIVEVSPEGEILSSLNVSLTQFSETGVKSIDSTLRSSDPIPFGNKSLELSLRSKDSTDRVNAAWQLSSNTDAVASVSTDIADKLKALVK